MTDLGGAHHRACRRSGGSTADVDIRGAINRSGALAITGKVNPLAKDIALDVQVSVKDVELPPASPYTGKYVGYAISKGKLDLALAYKIAGPQARRAATSWCWISSRSATRSTARTP